MTKDSYQKPIPAIWNGRKSNTQLYFHEKIKCIPIDDLSSASDKHTSFAILGYSCDEGVKRNLGRVGAVEGPDAVRKMLASISNHLSEDTAIVDTGTIYCNNTNLELTQEITTNTIQQLLNQQYFPIVIGGGHDLAYAHYRGIKKTYPNQNVGIINLDAHFDLRKVSNKGNSGTPFYQIATEQGHIDYLCLGIQKAANNRELFEIADQLEVEYIENTNFTIDHWQEVLRKITSFINKVDHIYLTIDMDGFSSAYAPGVSAPSPLGFTPDIAFKTIKHICRSNKLISVDLVELNPKYDMDNSTARLAARIIYDLLEKLSSMD